MARRNVHVGNEPATIVCKQSRRCSAWRRREDTASSSAVPDPSQARFRAQWQREPRRSPRTLFGVLDGLLIGIVPLVHPEWTWRNHDDWHGWNLRMLRADDSQKVKRIFHAAIVSHLRTIGALMTRAARSSTHFTASAAVRDPACLQPAFLRNLEEFAPMVVTPLCILSLSQRMQNWSGMAIPRMHKWKLRGAGGF